jgi:hypothetical protein
MAAATNRHSHFITALETKLDTITNLNIITKFDLDNWANYEMPYAYVELAPDILTYQYEDFVDFDGVQDFVFWVGIETSADGDLRDTTATLTLSIEKAFKRFSIANLDTSNFTLTINSVRITGIHPVQNYGDSKIIYITTGDIKYSIVWK